ncbi:MAG: DUF4159 domain-containing protein [Chlorobi bacterium]|nr:DUF4159 domain-containing protein [Chlorobiota bacterium]
MKKLLLLIYVALTVFAFGQQKSGFRIARLKYPGGGDWYNDPSAEVNLLRFVAENTTVKTVPDFFEADVSSDEIFNFPFLFITGHGNIILSNSEAKRLREYCEKGGFIYVDDDYGLDRSFRKTVKQIFPGAELTELPFNHDLYHIVYDFEFGPPKTHEHNGKPPQGFGIFWNGRLVLYYTYESNPSDGWADPQIHHDPEWKRLEALKFGTNLIVYVLTKR